jgi:hypothetical protein
MYIRSSPCGPNRDLNRTLSNELLLLLLIKLKYGIFNKDTYNFNKSGFIIGKIIP